jgi:glutamyl-Q tRNA(Asp) synthetase
VNGYRGRFAPSPTGPLHFGSLVAAVASWLDARASQGQWMVRIEDVDETRTVPGAADAILRSLESMGLEWDGEVVFQSRRKPLYEEALRELALRDATYRCRCSRREVADAARAGAEGAIYPGTCRMLAPGEGEAAATRVHVEPGTLAFTDRLQGPIAQDVACDVGDFVVKRRDGLHAYQLAVVVDDAAQAITDVVRGADLLWSTPRQVALQRLLGLPTPRYLHFPVAADAKGEKLSKQTRAAPMEDGSSDTLRRALAFLGQASPEAVIPREMLRQAARTWQAQSIPRGASRPAQGS